MSVADAMATNGMKELGYEYINLDGMWILTVLAHCSIRIPYEDKMNAWPLDCWADYRDSQGNIVPDKSRFPEWVGADSVGVDSVMSANVNVKIDCTLSPAVGWCQSFSIWILWASSLDWYVHVWYWYAVIQFIWFHITHYAVHRCRNLYMQQRSKISWYPWQLWQVSALKLVTKHAYWTNNYCFVHTYRSLSAGCKHLCIMGSWVWAHHCNSVSFFTFVCVLC